MPMNRKYRIAADELRTLIPDFVDLRGLDFVAAYERWCEFAKELDEVIARLEKAFTGQKLGGGIGLLEANAIDEYASLEERAIMRQQDEHYDWKRIEVERLNECYAAPTYFDAAGFAFHLPAFLIAELNDQYDFSFIDRLIDYDTNPTDWDANLTIEQREAVAAALSLVSKHPEYMHRSEDICVAIKRLVGDR
jgi:hypothetical protein